ncbi:hypothetical protein [Helicobacter sp. UBA3407]|uniref:hypothetical protein n=1 Tax=Helicobacter TaxID=209 RepID=UPI002613523C|nr:hypothetical protein [Helicobacter sp. UBA3407]
MIPLFIYFWFRLWIATQVFKLARNDAVDFILESLLSKFCNGREKIIHCIVLMSKYIQIVLLSW